MLLDLNHFWYSLPPVEIRYKVLEYGSLHICLSLSSVSIVPIAIALPNIETPPPDLSIMPSADEMNGMLV